MNERHDIERAERIFMQELLAFARVVNARSMLLLETARNLERRRAIVEAARRVEGEGHVEEPNQAS